MLQSCSLSGYEIFSQFFLDRPTLSCFLSLYSVLQGKRIHPSLNDFTIRCTEAPSLQRICIRMCCKKDLLANTFEDQRSRGLQTVQTKCTLFYVNPGIQIPDHVKATVNKRFLMSQNQRDSREEIRELVL